MRQEMLEIIYDNNQSLIEYHREWGEVETEDKTNELFDEYQKLNFELNEINKDIQRLKELKENLESDGDKLNFKTPEQIFRDKMDKINRELGEEIGWDYSEYYAEFIKQQNENENDNDSGEYELTEDDKKAIAEAEQEALYAVVYEPAVDPLIIDIGVFDQQPLYREQYEEGDHPDSGYQQDLVFFDINCDGKTEMIDRKIVGTPYLFADIDMNGVVTCGAELFMNPYGINVYDFLSALDEDGNHIIDYRDEFIFSYLKVTNFNETLPLTIEYVNLYNEEIEDDYVGDGESGSYTDGDNGYYHDGRYYEEKEKGWDPIEYSTNHARADRVSEYGIKFKEYNGPNRTFSGIFGAWFD
jgi:hypothetical protein